MPENSSDHANVITFPPIIFLIAFIIGLVLHLTIEDKLIQVKFSGLYLSIIGYTLVFISLLIAGFTIKILEQFKTTQKVNKPTTTIVTEGTFRCSRNPIYTSGFILFAGLSLIMNSIIMLLLIIPVFFVIREGVVKREEQYLESKFGQEYMNYKTSVRRWL